MKVVVVEEEEDDETITHLLATIAFGDCGALVDESPFENGLSALKIISSSLKLLVCLSVAAAAAATVAAAVRRRHDECVVHFKST